MCGSTPVREVNVGGSGVFEEGNKRGEFFFLRPPDTSGSERAVNHQAHTTHYPPTDLPTTAVQQHCSSRYRAIHNGRTAAVQQQAAQQYTWNAKSWVGICTLLPFSACTGESASRPRERLCMPPARRVGNRRQFCRRRHGGVMCEVGVARAYGLWGPGGER